MSSSSLTKQAGFLIAGRMLSMPLAFLVPVVLTRMFTVVEFGFYKQLFLIFNMLMPIIDIGITNSLYYLLPKYSAKKNTILLQTILIQAVISVIIAACFLFFSNSIANLFTSKSDIDPYLPLLCSFTIFWQLSNILEVILIVEKKAFVSGVVTFASEAAKALSSIIVALLGGGLIELLIALLIVGGLKFVVMSAYLFKSYTFSWQSLELKIFKSHLYYAIPFGLAVIVNGFVGNIHQYIVSVNASVATFAIFSVGCFQLPLLGVVVDSIAKTTLVRMSEMRNEGKSLSKISMIVAGSCRKLWLLFFPVYVILSVLANEFIEILFTSQYSSSVPVFRVFIIMIPLSAILIQHVPRAFSETRFILLNNVLTLILSFVFCSMGYQLFGLTGVAIGFITAQAVWKTLFLFKCKQLLKTNISDMIPIQILAKPTLAIIALGICTFFIKVALFENVYISFLLPFVFFSVSCIYIYWNFNFLSIKEKKTIGRTTKRYLVCMNLSKSNQ